MAIENTAQVGGLILNPLRTIWLNFLKMAPTLIIAVLIAIIGYFIGWLLGYTCKVLLKRCGFEKKLEESKFSKMFSHTTLPKMLEEIVKWYVFVIFLSISVSILNLGSLNILVTDFLKWLPNVIAAILIVIAGGVFGSYVEWKIRNHTKFKGVIVIGKTTNVLLVILAILVALKQIGIKTSFIENIFLILFGGLALGLALTLGIGFGLGFRGYAERFIGNLKKKR